MRGGAQITGWLEHWAQTRGPARALTDAHGTLSYLQLRDEVRRLSHRFERARIARGTTVLLLPDVSAESVATYWALRAMDVCIAVGDPGATLSEVAEFLERTGARHVISGARASPFCRAEVGTLWGRAAAPHAESALCVWPVLTPTAVDVPEAAAVILFSSGTTGQPKAIMHSHASITGLHDALLRTWALGPADIVLGALPFHTIYGLLFSAGTAIYAGAHLVVMARFTPEAALTMIATHRVSTAALVPAMLLMMLAVEGRERVDLSSLQMVYSASAPISESDRARFEAFSGAEVLVNYGMTEIPGAAVERRAAPHAPGAVGRTSPGFEIVARDGDGLALGPGQTGEISMRGPSQMLAYLGDPDQTARRVRDGWVYSEDIGTVAEDGTVRLSGRLSDMILRGGLNISPLEIEAVLSRHSAVLDAAVIGLPDPVLGQIPVAVVATDATDTAPLAERLRAHCAQSLSKPKVPAQFHFRAALPRNDGGKVLRKRLVEELQQEE